MKYGDDIVTHVLKVENMVHKLSNLGDAMFDSM
jgi:hypothetical protein